MALVYLKNILFPAAHPSRSKHRSSPLPSFNNHVSSSLDAAAARSRATFEDSSDSAVSDDPLLSEKHAAQNQSSQDLDDDDDNDDDDTGSTSRIDPRVVSDAIIGLSDGLTVPFALTAGLSAFGSTKVVIFGGLAELIAGAISMGLGGYLAAMSEAEAYHALESSTSNLVQSNPERTASLIRTTLLAHLPALATSPMPMDALARHIQQHSSTQQLTSFLLAFHHKTTAPGDSRSAVASAATIATGYFVGGFVPLLPYFVCADVGSAFWWSVAVMAVALFVFGAVRTWCVCGGYGGYGPGEGCAEGMEDGRRGRRRRRAMAAQALKCSKGGLQMTVLGLVAAGAAMALVKAFGVT